MLLVEGWHVLASERVVDRVDGNGKCYFKDTIFYVAIYVVMPDAQKGFFHVGGLVGILSC